MTTKTKRMPATAQIQNLFSQNPEMLKDIVKEALEEILDKEMSEALGAERAERTESRLGYRSGHYTRGLVTRIGKLELRVPRDRDGRFSTDPTRTRVSRWRCARSYLKPPGSAAMCTS